MHILTNISMAEAHTESLALVLNLCYSRIPPDAVVVQRAF